MDVKSQEKRTYGEPGDKKGMLHWFFLNSERKVGGVGSVGKRGVLIWEETFTILRTLRTSSFHAYPLARTEKILRS